jgi:hypothetical protein
MSDRLWALHPTINLNILFIEKAVHLKPRFFTQLRWWAFATASHLPRLTRF